MNCIISTPGVFHHFALARELVNRSMLDRIYTGYPWFRVKREEMAMAKVKSFPYFHMPLLAGSKYLRRYQPLYDVAALTVSGAYDRVVAFDLHADVPPGSVDYVIAASGSGFHTGQAAQQSHGATYVCDRGSSHMRYQANLMREEYARWKVPPDPERTAAIRNEEREYEQADLIFVPSEFAYRSFVEMGVPKTKLRKAVLAADTSFFYPVAEPDENEFCVLYVGQISFRKGIPYLLEAFKRLSHPKKRLRMIGAVEPRIRKYLQTAPLAQVEFEGNQPRDVVREAMSKAHVTVLPSVEDGFGMVLAEAMACGCPVISTENTGGADLYQHGCQGLIIPIRSGDEINSALNYLAECPHIRAEMGERARQRMSGYWSGWKQYGDTVARHLREHVAVCA